MEFKPKILSGGESRNDDQIMADNGHGGRGEAGLPGEDSPLVIMELLQRLRVRDVMRSRDIISVTRDDSLRVAKELMRVNKISGVPVLEDGRLFGIVSVNNIIMALEGGWIDEPCHRHMSTSLVVLEEGMPLAFAIKYFQNYTFGRFPVLNKDRVFVGIVSQRDVTRVLMHELTSELAKLEGKSKPVQEAPKGEVAVPNYSMNQFVVVHNDLTNAGKAANEIKKKLKDAGVNGKIIRKVAVAAYELEINICIHSVGGTITFIMDEREATVIAKDRGPGIADIEWACQDGTSTANDWIRSMGFGAGMGLSNSKRVADTFEIQSKVPTGTTVVCKFKLKEKMD